MCSKAPNWCFPFTARCFAAILPSFSSVRGCTSSPSLGFPWILSSESRLFNGLRGLKRRSFFLALFPSVRSRQTGACDLGMRKCRIVHGPSLTRFLIFSNMLSFLRRCLSATSMRKQLALVSDSEVLRISSQRPRPEASRSGLEGRSSTRRSGRRLLEHPSRRETSPRSSG
jgi:hypothetical protein